MTTLEELLEVERSAVDPTDEDRERATRKVAGALGFGVLTVSPGVTASSGVGIGASLAEGSSATGSGAMASLSAAGPSKLAAVWGAKTALGWAAGTLALGLGLAAALLPSGVDGSSPSSVSVSNDSSATTGVPAAKVSAESKAPVDANIISPSSRPAPLRKNSPLDNETIDTPAPAWRSSDRQTASPGIRKVRPSNSGEEARTVPPQKSDDAPTLNKLQEDARLLSGVTAALNRGHYLEALSLLSGKPTHRSALASEFSAARAVALCRLGRYAEGKAQSAALEKMSPNSPALLRVRRACTK